MYTSFLPRTLTLLNPNFNLFFTNWPIMCQTEGEQLIPAGPINILANFQTNVGEKCVNMLISPKYIPSMHTLFHCNGVFTSLSRGSLSRNGLTC